MKKGIVKGIILLLLGIVVTACHKDDDNGASDGQARELQEVMERAQHVMTDVSAIFKMSDNVSDMSLHLDEIKAMENVEDAWQEDNSIAVKIQDGGIIKWCFFPQNTISQEEMSVYDGLKSRNKTGNDLLEEKSACISVTIPYESRVRASLVNTINAIAYALEDIGYSVHWKLGNEVTPGFIYNQMPQYGLNIIITHGDYDKNGQHWIMTGVELGNATMIDNIQKWMTKSEWVSDRVQLWCQEEVRNGDTVRPWYLAVSEVCINEKMHQHFPQNSLMFVGACLTLKDNPSLWNVLKNKGLGCYFGYDDTVNTLRVRNDLLSIMQRMLGDGFTAQTAYSQTGAGANPHLLLYPGNSNIVLVESDDSDWVDLGLPSGLLWATRNVGASSPTDNGNYYAWGETSPKSSYTWNNYQWGSVDSDGHFWLTKYNTNSFYGPVDDLTILQPSDDAATVNYGGRMPTWEEWKELMNNTTYTWTTINGVNGGCFTGPNGNSIFLPAAGRWYGIYGFENVGTSGSYWSSSLLTNLPMDVMRFPFNSSDGEENKVAYRSDGNSVRAVRQR